MILTSKRIVLVHAVQICLVGPLQWNAWDVNGKYYYLWFHGKSGWIGHNYYRDDAIYAFVDCGWPDIQFEDFCGFLGVDWMPKWYIPGMTLESVA